MQAFPKRLIEVDLPIRRISAHARREKSIRHGHISTLHVWFARRPLASCRAVICASLWPDPVDLLCPPAFRELVTTELVAWARDNLGKSSRDSYKALLDIRQNPGRASVPAVQRQVLLDFLADFANWDNANDPAFVGMSTRLTQGAHVAMGGASGSRPLVIDPFAGGGAIPLEALRVGADAFAGDLNPIAVLLNKAAQEYVPRFGPALAAEILRLGAEVKSRAAQALSSLYPETADGDVTVAYLWARTVRCEGPNCGAEVPLLRSVQLSKRKGSAVGMEVVPDKANRTVGFRLPKTGETITAGAGTVKGGAATCPVCGFTTSAKSVRAQLTSAHGGARTARMYAVYCEGTRGRFFRLADESDLAAYEAATKMKRKLETEQPGAFPSEPINPIRPYKNTRGLSAVTRVGCATFGDLYNDRQAVSILTLFRLVAEVVEQDKDVPEEMRAAVATLLAFAVSRSVSQNTTMSRWDASRLTIKGAFSKQALAVVWDFAEANPFSGGTSDWDGALGWVVKFIEACSSIDHGGHAMRVSATSQALPDDSAAALVCDPPYFAAIPYADLSDFFFVWLKRALKGIHPDLFVPELTEKSEELIVTNAQKTAEGGAKDDSFFRKGMTKALEVARREVMPSGIGVVVYAESTTAGWEAVLGAIIEAGWVVTASWPIETEMENRTRAQNTASLQSSVHIVCRPREALDGTHVTQSVGDWRDVQVELPARIHEWMPRLAEEGIVGADAIFACLGPALEVFSRYHRVEKANGDVVELREYLEAVWSAVSKEALSMIFSGADSSRFEEDARLTAMWLWTMSTSGDGDDAEADEEEHAEDEEDTPTAKTSPKGFLLDFDAARKIAQGLGINLTDISSVVETHGDSARLLPVSERAAYLFGKNDALRPSKRSKSTEQLSLFSLLGVDESDEAAVESLGIQPGKSVLDRVHQALLLFSTGRSEALKRFLVGEGVGRDQGFWSLAQALSALYPSNVDEKRWVDGLLARKKGLGF
ncbi:DUF1156 domain-containing protein [Burkholderia multivorans]|nr:DUF1156 domain-containing protein [Burkholderia multivorans]